MVRTFHDAIRRDLFEEGCIGAVESFRLCPLAVMGCLVEVVSEEVASTADNPSSPKEFG